MAVRSSLCLLVRFCVFSPYWRRWHGGICRTSATGGVAFSALEHVFWPYVTVPTSRHLISSTFYAIDLWAIGFFRGYIWHILFVPATFYFLSTAEHVHFETVFLGRSCLGFPLFERRSLAVIQLLAVQLNPRCQRIMMLLLYSLAIGTNNSISSSYFIPPSSASCYCW